jgi:tetratricopeptide (TPR) repeat protein
MAILATVLYIIGQNQTPTTLTLFSGWKLENYTLGTLTIIIFCAGIVCSSIAGLFIGFPTILRSWKIKRELKKSHDFYEKISEARKASTTAQWEKARLLWSDLLQLDPTDVVAAIELSRAVENLGDPRQALKDITHVKNLHPTNIEALYRAAELQEKLGNKTSALDNLMHILSLESIPYVYEQAARLALETGNYEYALEYYSKIDHPTQSEKLKSLGATIGLRNLQNLSTSTPLSEQIAKSQKLLKKFPQNSAVYRYVAQLLVENGKATEAIKILITAIKNIDANISDYSNQVRILMADIISLTQKNSLLDETIILLSGLIKDSTHSSNLLIQALLNKARLEIEKKHLDSAKKTLLDLRSVLEQNHDLASSVLEYYRLVFTILEGVVLIYDGELDKAKVVLTSLLQVDSSLEQEDGAIFVDRNNAILPRALATTMCLF